MPTPTYIPLATKTLTATAATVTFSSISQAYRDLVCVMQVGATLGASITATFNGDSGTNYSRVFMMGNGSTTTSSAPAAAPFFNFTANSYTDLALTTGLIINVFDYSATDKHKTVLSRSDIASGTYPATTASASRWASTAAVTSFTLGTGGNTFSIGSTFTLYGIASA